MFLTELLPGPFQYQRVTLCQIVASRAEDRARAIRMCLVAFGGNPVTIGAVVTGSVHVFPSGPLSGAQ